MPWLTPDAPEDNRVRIRRIRVPEHPKFMGVVNGALAQLGYDHNWEKEGNLEPEEVAEMFREIWQDYIESNVMRAGEIVPFTGSTIPQYALECDGASYSADDYPHLFEVIGYQFGGGVGTFNVPDLRGRTVVGVGEGIGLTGRTIGETGGEEAHQLIESEMPVHVHEIPDHDHTTIPHSHQSFYPIFNVDLEGVGAPDVLGAGNPPTTLPTTAEEVIVSVRELTMSERGGDNVHENMPPFIALRFIIYTE